MGTAQAKRLDLIGHRGLPFLADFVFLDNLTGMTACEFSLRNHPDNPTSLILLALASGVGEGVHLLYADE
jgi:outer membrane lipopolysaccharide assembly protein LptE/RlpB